MSDQIAVSFRNVSMRFPGVLANDRVSLDVRAGEVFALVGENGAGKSTLMRLLYGLHTPTAGEIYAKGQRVMRYNPAAAIAMGIGMVHQHFMLVPSFTVAQNIVLSREPRRRGLFVDQKAAEDTVRELSRRYGLKVDPRARVSELGLGVQQRVEILKTLHRGAEILILDEPTAVLTPGETDELFAVIRRIVSESGMTVILITHKLYEVMAVSDRVGVMRRGKLVGVRETRDVNEKILAQMMVGQDMPPPPMAERAQPGAKAIYVENLQALDDRGLPAVKGMTLDVRAGEILGVAGIEGNGQSELIEALAGLRPVRGGDIEILGKRALGLDPGQIRALGVAHIPEDRLRTGVSAKASVTENLLAGRQRKWPFSKFGHLRRREAKRHAEALYAAYDVRGAGVESPAGALSGGNLQKIVVAREFDQDAKVLLIAQPTRGVDIGAMEFIHGEIIKKRDRGAAILLLSADLDEILRLSDRIVTVYEGKITGEFTAGQATREQIGIAMTGGEGAGAE